MSTASGSLEMSLMRITQRAIQFGNKDIKDYKKEDLQYLEWLINDG